MRKKHVWGIIGLGWLGSALAQQLEQAGQLFWGTHRGDFDWLKDRFPEDFCDVLFLNTPPLLSLDPEDYVGKIPIQKGQRIIFISSTSVYGSQSGEVVESTLPQPLSESQNWLCKVEQSLLEKFKDQVVVIRPGGLIGGARHPVYYLAGCKLLADGLAPVNLIHREDLLKIIMTVAQAPSPPSLINAVAPFHPSRADYYSGWARKLGLPEMSFRQEAKNAKLVKSEVLAIIHTDWNCPLLDRL